MRGFGKNIWLLGSHGSHGPLIRLRLHCCSKPDKIIFSVKTLQLTWNDLDVAGFEFAPPVDVPFDDGPEPAPADHLVGHLQEVSRNRPSPGSQNIQLQEEKKLTFKNDPCLHCLILLALEIII